MTIPQESNGLDETSKEDFTGIYSGQQQTLLSAGIWQTSGALIAGFFAWLLDLIVAREDIGLGADGIGVLNLGSAIFSICTLVMIGIKKSTSQKISENILDNKVALKEARNGAFAILNMSIGIGIGLIIISFFIGSPLTFQNGLSSILFIIGTLMFFNWYREGTQGVLSGIGEYDTIAKSHLFFFIAQLVSGLLLVFFIRLYNLQDTIYALIFIAYGIGVIAQVILLNKYFKPLRPFYPETFRFHFREHALSKNTKHGFLFAISEIVPLNILGAASLVVLFAFTNFRYSEKIALEITGAYSIVIGYSLAGLLITNFTWPLITHIADAFGKGDHEKISYNLKLVVKLFFYLTSLVLVILMGLSHGFILIIYGKSYVTGYTNIWIPFMLMVIGSSIASFEYILCCVLLGVGKRKPAAIYLGTLFLMTVVWSCLFLSLNLINPQIDCALGYLIGNAIMLLFLPYLMRKEINQKIPFSIGVRSIFALITTLAISVVLFWPPLNLIPLTNFFILILCLIFLGAIYLFFLVFYGGVSEEDIEMFREKIEEYNKLKRVVGPILTFLQKIMEISPFCKSDTPDKD